MATTPLNSAEGKAPAKPPISQHPAFPAIVALWFACLLGLGSLVLPVVLLESIVTTTGVSTLIPAATPPLGVTARGLLALAAAGSGAGLGVLLARHVAAGHRAEPRSRGADRVHRPLNARLDLGEDGLMAGGVKRRSLAMADEGRQSDFLSHAPLPGEDPWASPAPFSALFDQASPVDEAPFQTRHEAAPEPLELGPEMGPEPDLDLANFGRAIDPYQPYAPAAATGDDDLHEDAFMNDKQEFHPLTLGQQEELQRQEFTRADPASFGRAVRGEIPADTRAPFEAAPFGFAQGEAEPLHFAAPSLARQEAAMAAVPAADAAAADAWSAPVADLAATDAEDLGMVQLVQRLGHSLEKRREQLALDAQQKLDRMAHHLPAEPVEDSIPEPEAVAPSAFEAARPEEAAQAMAAFFGKPAGVPVPRAAVAGVAADPDAPGPQHFARGLAHLSDDDAADDEEDGDKDEYLPSSFTLPLRAAIQADDVAEDEHEAEFGSLLSLNNPFAQLETAFVRIDEPEADEDLPPAGGVVFPGQVTGFADSWPGAADASGRTFDRPAAGSAPRKPNPEMDEALRSALSKLQRMSGAA